MVGLTAIQSRYTGFSPKSADEFNSASRSVKPGLIAAGIVSAWTWAATLVCYLSSSQRLIPAPDALTGFVSKLQSSAVAYKYGISGPWWYGSGATIQVLLFAQVRIVPFTHFAMWGN
jgi:Na+/proline symporter